MSYLSNNFIIKTRKEMYLRLTCKLLLVLAVFSSSYAQSENIKEQTMENNNGMDIATLGTGCFWCTEAIFQDLEGVKSAESGYAGGHVENPTYEEVCAKTTGHAEVIKITFDPSVISFEELLEVFWRTHNPTTLNQQGNDVGPQYRSAIFYHNEEQKAIAEKSLKEADAINIWPDPIVTEITAFTNYYKAEDYHQEYYDRVGTRNPYCVYVVKPKVDKFKKQFKDKLKKEH